MTLWTALFGPSPIFSKKPSPAAAEPIAATLTTNKAIEIVLSTNFEDMIVPKKQFRRFGASKSR